LKQKLIWFYCLRVPTSTCTHSYC